MTRPLIAVSLKAQLPSNGVSYGRLGREATRFLNELGHVAVESGHVTKAAVV